MLRRNGWDDINRITGRNRFNSADCVADKTNKKVNKRWLNGNRFVPRPGRLKERQLATARVHLTCATTQFGYVFSKGDSSKLNSFTHGEIRIEAFCQFFNGNSIFDRDA